MSPLCPHLNKSLGRRDRPSLCDGGERQHEQHERVRAVRMLGSLVDSPPLQTLCDEARAHFSAGYAGVHLLTDEDLRVEVLAGALTLSNNVCARAGLAVPSSWTICSDAIANPEARTETCGVLVVEDVAKSEQFRDRAVRTGFYAASPIRYAATDSSPGQVVGTLCLYDEAPREGFGAEECRKLREYSDKVTAILAAPLPSCLGGNAAEQSRLQSIEERVSVLAVSAQMVCVGAARGRACCL